MPLNVVLIDRSDIFRTMVVYPAGHSKYPEGRSLTGLEVMREEGSTFMRADIALVNLPKHECPTCECAGMGGQALVFADADGYLCGDGVKYLDASQLAWCRNEAATLVSLAETYPEVRKHYLRGF